MSLLEVKNVSKSFGGVKANVDISVSVEQGSIVGLIGPNGSGKTTLFNSIVGTHPIDQGSIVFNNTEVSEMPVPAVAKLGLLRTFQQTRIYSKLNCVENMLISHKASDSGFIFAKIPPELTEKAENLLNFVGLYQKRNLRAGDLSFGQQKLLELAMALMNEPKMLLLDEPTAGINPTLINGIIDRLIKINKDYGITLLVIEHNMKVIMSLAQSIFCLAHGKLLAEGSPDQIKNDKRVVDAYLRSTIMANQYEVLGKAPDIKDLQKLSGSNLHLQIKNLNAGYGKMEILHNFNLLVDKAQSLCLIGPNGAGKSTILHSIYGFTNIFSGQIEIDGNEITKLTPAQKLKSCGIAYILQDNSVFPDMTVEENLLMGGYIKDKTEESYAEAKRVLEKYERLNKRRNQPAKVLSGGERRLLEISRALVMRPSILLVDEPSIGLEPRYIKWFLKF